MINKKCFKCGVVKELSHFYKHNGMADGHLGKCKDCTKKESDIREKYLRKTSPEFVESERIRGRKKAKRLPKKEVNKISKRETMLNYRNKYPEKYKAKIASQKLPRKEGCEFHHWSYNEIHYKDIIELNTKEHGFIHRYMTYDQERKMYRDLDGVLLDTKESHLNNYKKMLEIKEF